ncbi:MAG TPA: peptide transporter, partial [Nautiliaceae bacterium]|nr:peptide transporter [Nautiliaceae bacterium]
MILVSLFFIILYQLWYPGSRNVLLAIFGMAIFYSLLKREKENFIFILFLGIPLLGFNIYIKLLLIGVLYTFYLKKREYFLESKNLTVMYIGLFLLLLLSGSLNSMISAFFGYFNRSSAIEQDTLHFFNVVKTVREAGAIPYDLVAKRISGSVLLFFFSAIGYVLILIRFPVMIITLPSVIIGLMAYKLGLRFTIYAVPFFALGFSYLAVLISEHLSKLLIDEKVSKYTKIGLPIILILPSLYLNRVHAIDYKTPTTLIKPEVETLFKLSKIATPQDYVLTWWDYGYPIRYYANVKTLIDGGKHSGEDNFPVSFALTQNQIKAANIARLNVEYTDKVEVAKELGQNLTTKGFIKDMMKEYGFKNPNEFLNALGDKNFTLPKKTRDVYFYFPFRMTDIYPTVALFSSIDLVTGKVDQPFIIPTSVANVSDKFIQFSNGMVLDLKRGSLVLNKSQAAPINRFYISFYDKNGKFRVIKQQVNPASNVNIVWYKTLNKVLIVSNSYFDSTYVQMFFLENYDKELFEPVILNPFVKIYKLKK